MIESLTDEQKEKIVKLYWSQNKDLEIAIKSKNDDIQFRYLDAISQGYDCDNLIENGYTIEKT